MKRITQCYRVHFLWAGVRIILGVGCPVRPLERALGRQESHRHNPRWQQSGGLRCLGVDFWLLAWFCNHRSIDRSWLFSVRETGCGTGEQTLPYTLAGVHCGNSHLAFATVICIVALVLDRDKQMLHWVMYFAAFGCILAAARVARCVWVLENIIKLVSQPSKRAS